MEVCYAARTLRKACIDASGALHHIICRETERQKIFYDDADRDNFLKYLGKYFERVFTSILLPNTDI